jgi:hypothetical protein
MPKSPENFTPIKIEWQDGLPSEVGRNGAFVEEILEQVIDRIRALNVEPLNCRENSLAITDLESARNWLLQRTRNRQARGVEGTYNP